MSSFLVAHNVNKLEVFPGEQQLVEVVQVDFGALVTLQSQYQSRNDCPLLFYPGHKMKEKC